MLKGDLPMTLDIHQQIFDEDGLPLEQEAGEHQDKPLELFEQSPEAQALSEEKHPTTRTHSYTPPLDKLLTYTSITGGNPLPKMSYIETFGIGNDNIPELIRMATDEYLRSEDANDFEFTAVLHAIRALGELHAEAAIEPLLSLLNSASEEDIDWIQETLIHAYPEIGPAALPSLEQFLADPSHNDSAHNYVAGIIERIPEEYPEARTECIAVVTRRLAEFEVNDPTLNGFLILALLHMKAVESANIIQEAYANDCVDKFVCGDWNEAQYELGLKVRPPSKARPSIFPTLSTPTPARSTPTPTLSTPNIPNTPVHKSAKKSPLTKKAQIKMAKRANRKRK
jgi:hypothetical protein